MGFILFRAPFVAKLAAKFSKKNKTKYDIVINNDMDMYPKYPGACHAYTKHCVKADKKCLVIHGDFIANNYDQKFFKKEYIPNYNYIIVLSEAAKKQLAGKNIFEVMDSNRQELNKQLPQYSQVTVIEVVEKEFEKTPKRSIKRFLYS